jgi:hypothetical protein
VGLSVAVTGAGVTVIGVAAPPSLASSSLALLVIGLIIQRLAASKRRGRDRQGVRADGAGLRQPCGERLCRSISSRSLFICAVPFFAPRVIF